MSEYTAEDVASVGKSRTLRPTRSDLKGKPGYYERPAKVEMEDGAIVDDPSGRYEWGVEAPCNDGNGRLNTWGHEVQEMMAASWREDSERSSRIQGRMERIPLKSERGVEFVPVAKLEETIRRTGWREHGPSVSMAGAFERGERRFCSVCRRHRDYCECGHGD